MTKLLQSRTFSSGNPGPKLIVLGAVHGNETCGTVAIGRVLEQIDRGEVRIVSGEATFVPVTNRLAFDRGTRNGERNLNRGLSPKREPRGNEDRIANELCPMLQAHDVLLDLHSFQSGTEPFVMVGPPDNDGTLQPFCRAAEEDALAASLGVARAVGGWLDTYSEGVHRRGGSVAYGIGTTEYMRSVGGYGVTLECGQHADPAAPEVAYRAILNAMAQLRMTNAPVSKRHSMEVLQLFAVTDKEHDEDRFTRPWKSFDAVSHGDVIGYRHGGQIVVAPSDGFIVFPNEKADAGTEWFYFARREPAPFTR